MRESLKETSSDMTWIALIARQQPVDAIMEILPNGFRALLGIYMQICKYILLYQRGHLQWQKVVVELSVRQNSCSIASAHTGFVSYLWYGVDKKLLNISKHNVPFKICPCARFGLPVFSNNQKKSSKIVRYTHLGDSRCQGNALTPCGFFSPTLTKGYPTTSQIAILVIAGTFVSSHGPCASIVPKFSAPSSPPVAEEQ